MYELEYVIPNYTGGGIYEYIGKLADGNYFMATDDYFYGDHFDIVIVDENPNGEENEEAWFPEWQDAHLVRYLDEAEAHEFTIQLLNWIIMNEPEGNYQKSDMEDMLSKMTDDLEEGCKKEEVSNMGKLDEAKKLNFTEEQYKKFCKYWVSVNITGDALIPPDGAETGIAVIYYADENDDYGDEFKSFKDMFDAYDIGECILNDYEDEFDELKEYGITEDEIRELDKIYNYGLFESKQEESIEQVARVYNRLRDAAKDVSQGKDVTDTIETIEADVERLEGSEKETAQVGLDAFKTAYKDATKEPEKEPEREARVVGEEGIEKPEEFSKVQPLTFREDCPYCSETIEYTFDPLNEISDDVVTTPDEYKVICPNCGKDIPIPPAPLDLVVVKIDEATPYGFFMELMDRPTARKCWINAFKNERGLWEFDFNNYNLNLDNERDILEKHFQEELDAYTDVVGNYVYEIAEEIKSGKRVVKENVNINEQKQKFTENVKKLRELGRLDTQD